MNDGYESRAYCVELEARDDPSEGATIIGRPIVYNQETDIGGLFKERIAPGALDKANLKDVRFLVNHDTSALPLARSRNNNGNSTMQLKPDEEGLGVRVSLDIQANADARALHSAVKRGDVSGMSFMFTVSDETWEDLDSDYPSRTINAIGEVLEVSAVTWPAYEGTDISARDARALDSARKALDSAKPAEPDGSADADMELEMLRAKYLYGI